MKRPPLRLALLTLALTAGRASANLHCVSNIADANGGSFCNNGSQRPSAQPQPTVDPKAAAQLVNAAGGVIGSMIGNGMVSPLPNPYQGHKPVKPVVADDDEDTKTPNVGTAASDIIGSYKPEENDSYASRLAHFRELHDAEMDQRREALAKLKGTSAEKWCAAHIGILFPNPPVVDVLNRYPDKVRAYDREKQIWDKRCGGPSAQPGYQGFTDELAGLKPDAAPAPSAVAGTTAKAPTYEAPAEAPSAAPAAEPEKPADAFADAEKELGGPPAKKTAPATDADSSEKSAPSDVGAAPDSAPSPDDSKNTNHSTNFFGQPNAKVTEKDLADTRAPELEDLRPGNPGAPSAGGAVVGGGGRAPSGVRAPTSNTNEPTIGSRTPQMISTKPAPNNFMPNMFSGSSPKEIERDRCQVSCSDVMAKQSEDLERFRRKSAAFPKAIILGPLNYGLAQAQKLGVAVAQGTDGVELEAAHFFDMFDLKRCAIGACLGVTDEAAALGSTSLHADKNGRLIKPNRYVSTVANWLHLRNSSDDPGSSRQPVLLAKESMVNADDLFAADYSGRVAALKYSPKKTSLLDSDYAQNLWDSKQDLRKDLNNTKKGVKAAVDYAKGIERCSQSDDVAADCFKENDKLWDKLTPMLKGTPAELPVSLVGAAKDAIQDYATDLLNTWKDLMSAAADCLGGCQ